MLSKNSICNRFPVVALSILVCGVACAEPLSVDDIIDRYVDAIGGRASIDAIENLVYTDGTYEEGDYKSDGDSTMSVARPWFKLVGDKENPGGYMEGYDGAAWEWFSDPSIVLRTVGAASEAIRHYAGVESPLVDYRDKGSSVELLGERELDERPVYVIRLTRRDGYVEQFYVNRDTYLINASSGEAPLHAFGEDITTVTRIADYRDVNGVLIAHRFVSIQIPSGSVVSSMQWESIRANLPLPEDWFSPPDFERTPLQHFIESLFGQRSDLDSVMWTYNEFVHAFPDVDTSNAVNVAGFQILKMGDIETAVALLEQNARDYPTSASTRFGLGRAYQTAGSLDRAREEYQAALDTDSSYERAKNALAAIAD